MKLSPRKRALIDVLNVMHGKQIQATEENIIQVICNIAKILKDNDEAERRYLINLTPKAEKKFITEIIYYLKKSIILDYTDFQPGGRH